MIIYSDLFVESHKKMFDFDRHILYSKFCMGGGKIDSKMAYFIFNIIVYVLKMHVLWNAGADKTLTGRK